MLLFALIILQLLTQHGLNCIPNNKNLPNHTELQNIRALTDQYQNSNRLLQSQPCNSGYYFNSEMQICEKCDGTCLNCTDSQSCTQCSNEFMQFKDIQGASLCQYCPSGSFYTQSLCQECDCQGGLCIENGKCLICENENQAFDLNTLECVNACSPDSYLIKAQIFQNQALLQFTYCKDSNLFVDSTSQQYLELGTRTYPYKTYDENNVNQLGKKSDLFISTNEHFQRNEDDLLIYAYDIQHNSINLYNLHFDLAGSIFQTEDPLNFQLINSTIRNEYQNFAISIVTDCSRSNKSATYGDIIIRNVSLIGDSIFEQKRPLFQIYTINNVTFNNNTISTFTELSNANRFHFDLNSVDNCKAPINDTRTKTYQFTNIFLITTNQPNITLNNIFIRNTTIQIKAGPIIYVTSNTNLFINIDERVDSQLIFKVSGAPDKSIVQLNNLQFSENTLYSNNAIAYDKSNQIIIRNSTFSNEKLYSSTGYLFFMKLHTFKIYDSVFSNFSYVDSSAQNSYAIKIVGMDLYPGLNNDRNPILINNSVFMNNTEAQIQLKPNDKVDLSNPLKLQIKNSQILGNKPIKDAFIVLQTNTILNLTNSIFKDNYSTSRGSIIFGDYQDAQIYLENSTFINNYALKGGVFYGQHSSFIWISECLFEKQSTISDITLSLNDDSVINILQQVLVKSGRDNTSLISSQNTRAITAKSQGGAIYLDRSNIILQNSQFNDCQSIVGGAISLSCTGLETCNYEIDGNTFQNNQATTKGGAIFYNRYQPIGYLQNSFTNNYAQYGNNIASYPYDIKLILMSNETTVSGQQYRGQIIVEVIDGTNHAKVHNGLAVFENLIFMAKPGSQNVSFKIQATTINSSNIKIYYNLSNDGQINQQYVFINFNLCQVGEIKDMFHFCYGGSQLSVNPGYWRSSNISTNIHKCLNKNACLGGLIKSEESADVTCKKGYGGNLCQLCTIVDGVKYSRTGFNTCDTCPEQGFNILLFQAVLLIFGFLTALVSLNIRSRKSSEIAVIMRILTNFLQIMSSTSLLDLRWPDSLKSFFMPFTYVGDSVQSVIYFDCFLQNSVVTNDKNSFVYFKTILICFLPVFLVMIYCSAFFIATRIKQIFKDKLLEWTIVMTVIVVYFTQPTVTRALINLLYCIEIDTGEYWLQSDLSIKCWEGDHSTLSMAITIPFLGFWVVGLPFATFLYLRKNRYRLGNVDFQAKFKTLCQGLRSDCYYWEFVNIFRKIFLVFINVFLQTQISLFKAMVSMLVLGIIYRIQTQINPYRNAMMNKLERREMIASIVCFYGSLFFINDEIQDGVRIVTLVLIILTNLWFLMLWWYLVMNSFKIKATLKIANCLRFFTLLQIKKIDIKKRLAFDSSMNNYLHDLTLLNKEIETESQKFERSFTMKISKRKNKIQLLKDKHHYSKSNLEVTKEVDVKMLNLRRDTYRIDTESLVEDKGNDTPLNHGAMNKFFMQQTSQATPTSKQEKRQKINNLNMNDMSNLHIFEKQIPKSILKHHSRRQSTFKTKNEQIQIRQQNHKAVQQMKTNSKKSKMIKQHTDNEEMKVNSNRGSKHRYAESKRYSENEETLDDIVIKDNQLNVKLVMNEIDKYYEKNLRQLAYGEEKTEQISKHRQQDFQLEEVKDEDFSYYDNPESKSHLKNMSYSKFYQPVRLSSSNQSSNQPQTNSQNSQNSKDNLNQNIIIGFDQALINNQDPTNINEKISQVNRSNRKQNNFVVTPNQRIKQQQYLPSRFKQESKKPMTPIQTKPKDQQTFSNFHFMLDKCDYGDSSKINQIEPEPEINDKIFLQNRSYTPKNTNNQERFFFQKSSIMEKSNNNSLVGKQMINESKIRQHYQIDTQVNNDYNNNKNSIRPFQMINNEQSIVKGLQQNKKQRKSRSLHKEKMQNTQQKGFDFERQKIMKNLIKAQNEKKIDLNQRPQTQSQPRNRELEQNNIEQGITDKFKVIAKLKNYSRSPKNYNKTNFD
eukprot:403355584